MDFGIDSAFRKLHARRLFFFRGFEAEGEACLDSFDEDGEYFEVIADDTVVGAIEDAGFGVGVDGDDLS